MTELYRSMVGLNRSMDILNGIINDIIKWMNGTKK